MQRYPGLLVALHWLVAIAVIIAYVTSGDPSKPKDMLDYLVGQTHVLAGMSVFALTRMLPITSNGR